LDRCDTMEFSGRDSTQQWTVRNTFIEAVEDLAEVEDGFTLRRCKSDSELSSPSSNFSARSNGHLAWVSSSETDGSLPGTDGSLPGNSSSNVTFKVDLSSRGIYNVEESMLVYQRITDYQLEGISVEDTVSNDFADVDITQYIPIDPTTGALMSIGSIPHVTTGDCNRCSFLNKGTCFKQHFCLFCHFPDCTNKKTLARERKKNRANERKNKKLRCQSARHEQTETAHHNQASSSGYNPHNLSGTVISL